MVRSRHRPSSQRLPSLPRRNSAREKTIIDMLVCNPTACDAHQPFLIELNKTLQKTNSKDYQQKCVLISADINSIVTSQKQE